MGLHTNGYINVDLEELQIYVHELNKIRKLLDDILAEVNNEMTDVVELQNQVLANSFRDVSYKIAAVNEASLLVESSRPSSDEDNDSRYRENSRRLADARYQLTKAQDRHQHLVELCADNSDFFTFEKPRITKLLQELDSQIVLSVKSLSEYYDFLSLLDTPSNETAQSGNHSSNKTTGVVSKSGNDFLSSYMNTDISTMPLYEPFSQHEKINGLTATKQKWSNRNGTMVFNTPEETGGKLDHVQGKKLNFASTCGVIACVNVLRLAGVYVTEEQLVDFASTHLGSSNLPLCDTGYFDPFRNGCTSAKNRQEILCAFGIESDLVPYSIDAIVDNVTAGKGVIAAVNSNFLYNGAFSALDRHAVTITSVGMTNGVPTSVFVCDSGGISCWEYPIDHFMKALMPNCDLNVTKNIIR